MGPGGAPYVVAAQLGQYVPAAVLNLATGAQQDQACLDATEIADSSIQLARYADACHFRTKRNQVCIGD